MDGKPVHALFSLISPTVRTHLHLLSRLAFALHDTGFKKIVAHRGTPEAILREARRIEAHLPPRGAAGAKEQ
jgi:PTS system nitrogen regulatory IIA component